MPPSNTFRMRRVVDGHGCYKRNSVKRGPGGLFFFCREWMM